MIIYKATNLINGKVYIGQTIKPLRKRKSNHAYDAKNGSNLYFHKALRKYGIDSFTWQVVCICPNMNLLNEQEKYYILLYNSMDKGYNLTNGGLNYTRTQETKNKIRKKLLGHPVSLKARKKMSLYQQNMTDEHKDNIRKALTGKKKLKETLEKIRGKNHWNYGNRGKDAPNYGKRLSKDSIEKRSGENNWNYGKRGKETSMYGRHHTKETKDIIRQAALNISDETRKKMRVSQKIRRANELNHKEHNYEQTDNSNKK